MVPVDGKHKSALFVGDDLVLAYVLPPISGTRHVLVSRLRLQWPNSVTMSLSPPLVNKGICAQSGVLSCP